MSHASEPQARRRTRTCAGGVLVKVDSAQAQRPSGAAHGHLGRGKQAATRHLHGHPGAWPGSERDCQRRRAVRAVALRCGSAACKQHPPCQRLSTRDGRAASPMRLVLHAYSTRPLVYSSWHTAHPWHMDSECAPLSSKAKHPAIRNARRRLCAIPKPTAFRTRTPSVTGVCSDIRSETDLSHAGHGAEPQPSA